MKAMLLLLLAFAVFALPTSLVWLLGRRARIPGWTIAAFLLAGWLTIGFGWFLSQRAQAFLFPDTSPCYGTHRTPVSQYFPPDSFCRHADGEPRTVNGPAAKTVFWTAANTTVALTIAAVWTRRRQRA